jgi:hypothetical protein
MEAEMSGVYQRFLPTTSNESSTKPERDVTLSWRIGHVLEMVMVFVISIFAVVPGVSPRLVYAQSTSSITIPSSTAVGVGLAGAADYQINHNQQWKDYEDVVIIAALNEVAKNAANTGQPMTSAGYTTLGTQMRSWLDANTPQSQSFLNKDLASKLRYAVDTLCPMVASAPAGSMLPLVLGNLEKLKYNLLETAIDTTQSVPLFDPASYSRTTAANQFVVDRIEEASDLAQNDSQYAAAVNAVLTDLTGLDTANIYSDIQNAYGSAVPSLPTPNSDGSYTLNQQDLVTQYQSVVGNIQAIVDADLTVLENGASPAPQQRYSGTSRRASASLPLATGGGGSGSASKCGDACDQAQSAVTVLSTLVGFPSVPI